jgi:uncharacterized phage-associated protein
MLDHAEERGMPLTIMALIKVMYFAHGWNFVRTGEPLIRQEFEAWKNGPVVRAVWDFYRNQKDAPIDRRIRGVDPMTAQTFQVPYDHIDHETQAFVRSMVDGYGRYHAYKLADMTHTKGSPWDQVWNGRSGKVSAGMLIPNEAIKEFFCKASTKRVYH